MMDKADIPFLSVSQLSELIKSRQVSPVIDSKERSHRNRAGPTTAFRLASAPALSMCCGFTSEHLPIGLQIGGKPFAEQTVLNVA